MPRLSIVIPVLGDPQRLDDTLLSVLENRPTNCEILVVHNRPYHDPYDLGDEVRFIEAERGASMVACVNQAIGLSQSPVVHVLTCGVEVCPGWADAALHRFCNPDIAAVAAVVFDRNDRQTIVSAGWAYRVEGTALRLAGQYTPEFVSACQQDFCGPDPLAAFYRKSALDVVGGFSTWAGDALAGIDLAIALQQADFRLALEPQCLAHVSQETLGANPAFRSGRQAERFFWRWASSQGWLSSLAGHAALLVGQCIISLWRPTMLVHLVGRACGTLQTICSPRSRKRPSPVVSQTPTIIGKPHFAMRSARDIEQKSRVA